MQSKATTVEQYLMELDEERRNAIEAVRKMILKNLGKGFEEGMTYGMIGYYVPHSVYPPGYHCDPKAPLPCMGLASQKNHMSIYMMTLYENSSEEKAFKEAWSKTGRKLDMGKCCIRFRKLEDLALDLIANVVKRTNAREYIDSYEGMLAEKGIKHKGKLAVEKSAGKVPTAGSEAASAKRTTTVSKAVSNQSAKKSTVKSSKEVKATGSKSKTVKTSSAKKASLGTVTSASSAVKKSSAKKAPVKRAASKTSSKK